MLTCITLGACVYFSVDQSPRNVVVESNVHECLKFFINIPKFITNKKATSHE